jgi:hypothetical protein
MLNKNKELNNMTRYTLQVQLPSLGWVTALKTNEMVLMVMKKVNLENAGHKVKVIKEKK